MFNKNLTLGFLVTLILVLMFSSLSLAHCVWIETPGRVNPSEVFDITVYFGHPDEPISDRDMAELQLFTLTPEGEIEEIIMEKGKTYQQAIKSFKKEGEYVLIAERNPTRYRLQEIRDFAKRILLVGKETAFTYEPVGISLEINVVHSNYINDNELELTLEILYEGKKLKEGEIEVFKSLEPAGVLFDEIAEIELDNAGQITLTINPNYYYVLETDYRLPANEVEKTGLFIRQVRFRSTLFLGVY